VDKEEVKLQPIDEAGIANLVRNDTKSLLMVNVWATWCGPCVAELDEFTTMNRMYRTRRFKMVTISIDEPEKEEEALKVLKEHHLSATNYLRRAEDRDKFADASTRDGPARSLHDDHRAGGKVSTERPAPSTRSKSDGHSSSTWAGRASS